MGVDFFGNSPILGEWVKILGQEDMRLKDILTVCENVELEKVTRIIEFYMELNVTLQSGINRDPSFRVLWKKS